MTLLYWSTLPDERFSTQTSIASAQFLFLRQSLNLSQQFPFDFCSFPAGQGKPLPLGEPSLESLGGAQLSPVWLLLGIWDSVNNGKGKYPVRIHPAPQRDCISPLLSEELEADATLVSKSRSRSCITPWSQADFLPDLHEHGVGAGLFWIFLQLQGQKRRGKQREQLLRGLRTLQRHHLAEPLEAPVWHCLQGNHDPHTTGTAPA